MNDKNGVIISILIAEYGITKLQAEEVYAELRANHSEVIDNLLETLKKVMER